MLAFMLQREAAGLLLVLVENKIVLGLTLALGTRTLKLLLQYQAF